MIIGTANHGRYPHNGVAGITFAVTLRIISPAADALAHPNFFMHFAAPKKINVQKNGMVTARMIPATYGSGFKFIVSPLEIGKVN